MEQFLKEYLAYLRLEKNLSDNSVESYKNDLNKFLLHAKKNGISDLNRISTNFISEYFIQQRKKEVGSSTTSRYLSALKGFFSYLYNQSYIEKDPTDILSSSRKRRKLPSVLTF
jgi:integrase/recombinase XerD